MTLTIDRRNVRDQEEWLQHRVEALYGRMKQLERENQELKEECGELKEELKYRPFIRGAWGRMEHRPINREEQK